MLPWNNDTTIEKLILLRILSYIFQKLHQEVILALKIDRLERSKHLFTQFQQQQHYKKVWNMSKVNNKHGRKSFCNFEHVSHLLIVFLLLTLNIQMFVGKLFLVVNIIIQSLKMTRCFI